MSWTLQSSCPWTGQSWTSCPWTLSHSITSTAYRYSTENILQNTNEELLLELLHITVNSVIPLNHYLNNRRISKTSGSGLIIIVSLKHLLDILLLLLNYSFTFFKTNLFQKISFLPD